MGRAIGPMPQIVSCSPSSASTRASRRRGVPCGDPSDTESDDADGCDGSGACAPRSLDRDASSPSSDRAEARHAHRALWGGLLVRPWLLAPGTPRANEGWTGADRSVYAPRFGQGRQRRRAGSVVTERRRAGRGASGRGLVGAKGEYPLRASYLLAPPPTPVRRPVVPPRPAPVPPAPKPATPPAPKSPTPPGCPGCPRAGPPSPPPKSSFRTAATSAAFPFSTLQSKGRPPAPLS